MGPPARLAVPGLQAKLSAAHPLICSCAPVAPGCLLTWLLLALIFGVGDVRSPVRRAFGDG